MIKPEPLSLGHAPRSYTTPWDTTRSVCSRGEAERAGRLQRATKSAVDNYTVVCEAEALVEAPRVKAENRGRLREVFVQNSVLHKNPFR